MLQPASPPASRSTGQPGAAPAGRCGAERAAPPTTSRSRTALCAPVLAHHARMIARRPPATGRPKPWRRRSRLTGCGAARVAHAGGGGGGMGAVDAVRGLADEAASGPGSSSRTSPSRRPAGGASCASSSTCRTSGRRGPDGRRGRGVAGALAAARRSRRHGRAAVRPRGHLARGGPAADRAAALARAGGRLVRVDLRRTGGTRAGRVEPTATTAALDRRRRPDAGVGRRRRGRVQVEFTRPGADAATTRTTTRTERRPDMDIDMSALRGARAREGDLLRPAGRGDRGGAADRLPPHRGRRRRTPASSSTARPAT